MSLLEDIETYLKRTRTNDSSFGENAISDPNLLLTMRNGRTVRKKTEGKIRKFMGDVPAGDGPKRRRVQIHNSRKKLPIPTHLIVGGRDPCWRCGVRGDIGCIHQPRERAAA